MQAARFVVSGVVQGVYYRACTRQRAVALGLVGHARNQADGSVDVVAAGSAAALDALEAWLCRAAGRHGRGGHAHGLRGSAD